MEENDEEKEKTKNSPITIITNIISSNNNETLTEINTQLESIIQDLTKNEINPTIKKLENVISLINKIISLNTNNNKKLEEVIKTIKDLTFQMEELKLSIDKTNLNSCHKSIVYENGDGYEGFYRFNKREGKGTMFYKNGDRYEGDWKNGWKEGKGIFYWNNGDRYEGEFKNGNKEGKAIYYWKDGKRFEGDFRNNKIDGKGVLFYKEGDRYEGDWKNEKKEGEGIHYYKNGDREMGNYYNDKKVGIHIKLCKDGRVIQNNYQY